MYTIINIGRQVGSYTWFGKLFSPCRNVSPVFRLSQAVGEKWSTTGRWPHLSNCLRKLEHKWNVATEREWLTEPTCLLTFIITVYIAHPLHTNTTDTLNTLGHIYIPTVAITNKDRVGSCPIVISRINYHYYYKYFSQTHQLHRLHLHFYPHWH